jgi:hypothetical protein
MTTDLILVALIGVTCLAGFGLSLFKSATDKTEGAQLEAAKVTAVTASAETAIATAEANAPRTDLAVIDRIRAGTL